MDLLINFLKIKQLSRRRQLSLQSPLLGFSSHPLSLIETLFFRAKIIKIIKRRHKGNIKILSLRLNIRPYNRLDKEVINFKEYKEGLITPHNTKCFYYQNGKNKDGDEYEIYTQHQTPNEYYKIIIYLKRYTWNKRKVGDQMEL